jgi:hypothetical protein
MVFFFCYWVEEGKNEKVEIFSKQLFWWFKERKKYKASVVVDAEKACEFLIPIFDFGPSHHLPLLLAKLHPCDLGSERTEFLLRNWSPNFVCLPCWSINSLFVKKNLIFDPKVHNLFLVSVRVIMSQFRLTFLFSITTSVTTSYH